MAEGVADASGMIRDSGVGADGRPPEPAPDPVLAPKGWAWDRKAKDWVPRKRAAPGTTGEGDEPAGAPSQQQYEPGEFVNAPGAEGDPAPGWQQPGAEYEPEPVVITADDRKEIHALVALLYAVPAELLAVADPYCFEPLGERKTAGDITAAVTDIVCQSPKVARWAASAAGLRPWIKLAVALKPIGLGVLHHHILRDVVVELDRENRTMDVQQQQWSEMYPTGAAA